MKDSAANCSTAYSGSTISPDMNPNDISFSSLNSLTYRYGKRILDLVIALPSLLLVLLPLIPVMALLIWLDDGGHVFYSQLRIGRYGRPFHIWKFRSMRTTPDHLSRAASCCDERSSGLGRFLRITSIDELPQIWNVVCGDMSFIGPRPERPSFVAAYSESIPDYSLRHVARVGLTGLSQIEGLRGNTCLQIRTRRDLYYVQNWSFSLDLQIAAKTVGILLTTLLAETGRLHCPCVTQAIPIEYLMRTH
jgi:lipopolysaccharide/colanic/teichoic acid biosynthesis glycosyltransferase